MEDTDLRVENIVTMIDLGQEFDLLSLMELLEESECEPETSLSSVVLKR